MSTSVASVSTPQNSRRTTRCTPSRRSAANLIHRFFGGDCLIASVRPYKMTPLGYIARRVIPRPGWLNAPHVESIYSVANCMSEDFADYIEFWRHNGHWLFDRPSIITDICEESCIEISGLTFLYLESELIQYDADQKKWMAYEPDSSFSTDVTKAHDAKLLGYDVTTSYYSPKPEHSPLSCNHIASVVPVNKYCLIDHLDEDRNHIENGAFVSSEPGHLRVIAVHEIEIGTNQAMFGSGRSRGI